MDALKARRSLGEEDFSQEISYLRSLQKEQLKVLEQTLKEETTALVELGRMLKRCV